jgi:molecular chaperone HtpG
LNISRQALQDNALVAKLRRVITKRFLKYLDEEATREPEQYQKFWSTFGLYLKEGITSDYEYQKEIGKLLRFESSKSADGTPIALADYILRMNPEQKEIYYINGPNRAAIEAGPYVEMFTKKDIEILYTMEPIDDFVLSHLGEFEGKKLVSADSADLPISKDEEETKEDNSVDESVKLDKDALEELTKWMQKVLEKSISEVVISKRLVDAPAMIVNPDGHMTSTMERILSASRKEHGIPGMESSKKKLEINPKNPLIIQLAELHKKDDIFAGEVAKQIRDNAMIQAGLVVDPLEMVERNYKILSRVVQN